MDRSSCLLLLLLHGYDRLLMVEVGVVAHACRLVGRNHAHQRAPLSAKSTALFVAAMHVCFVDDVHKVWYLLVRLWMPAAIQIDQLVMVVLLLLLRHVLDHAWD